MHDLGDDEVDLAGFGQRLATPASVESLPGYARLPRLYERLFRPRASHHWVRIVMDRETRKLVQTIEPRQLDVLEISGDYWGRVEQFKTYRSVHYPEFDICASTLNEQFDLIVAEQVFEHLRWPYRAGKHVYEMLRPGGHFLMTTPFLIRVHNIPDDCSRWTETGLRYLLAECGFDLDRILTGSWGNRACARANFVRLGAWYRRWWHSLHNEPNFPVVVWAFGQK
jgi:SAM-dependent methyltransferase